MIVRLRPTSRMMSSSQQLRKSRPQPPSLPEPLSLEVDGKAIIKYIDVKPTNCTSSTPTIALIHGSPGNYKDFRYLMPLLQKDARVIAMNLPGFDDSVVTDKKNHFEHVSAEGVAKIAYEVLATLCKDDENLFIVGHSFGGHTITNLAAINLEQKKLNLRGMALLASAGHHPHRTLWVGTSKVFGSVISAELPVISSAAQSLVHFIYTRFVGFPNNAPTPHFVSALIRNNSTNYELMNKQRKQISQIPAFVAWAKDDPHIEEEISLRLSEEFHPGPRFAFDKGGHNIQKTKAKFLTAELKRWIDEIVTDGEEQSKEE